MDMTVKEYTWEEIRKHKLKSDRWIVVDDNVYDVSRWCWKHPGGERIIGSYAGQDASVSLLSISCKVLILLIFCLSYEIIFFAGGLVCISY